MIQELAVSVRSGDDSYMPKAISISVGNSESSLKEIKTIQIPRSVYFAGYDCLEGVFLVKTNLIKVIDNIPKIDRIKFSPTCTTSLYYIIYNF